MLCGLITATWMESSELRTQKRMSRDTSGLSVCFAMPDDACVVEQLVSGDCGNAELIIHQKDGKRFSTIEVAFDVLVYRFSLRCYDISHFCRRRRRISSKETFASFVRRQVEGRGRTLGKQAITEFETSTYKPLPRDARSFAHLNCHTVCDIRISVDGGFLTSP
jgi:hypothetical protein